jgi:hypothetical protein
MVQFDGAFAMKYSSRVARKWVLFENSIVCLVVLFLLLFFAMPPVFPVCGGVVFLMPVFGVFLFGSGFSD